LLFYPFSLLKFRSLFRKMSGNSLCPFDKKTLPFDSEERIKYWSVSNVRQAFIDYFCKQNGHTFVPSSGTVPHDDPTLLFANSGMAQFKPIFQGVIDPAAPFAKLRRAANSQKCIRAGGKHNDLEDVGKDVYHHTFFEMLGNWSFGDYFKKEAVDMAWELLTEVYQIPSERLYVTYFAGNEALGLPADLEARDLWIAKGFAPERVLPYGMKENFWEMGESGPCGPCSEIHFDRIGDRDASALVNADDPDVLEIWNLVFMQYNREADGSLRPLPNKHVDTGMGLERVTSVLQCKRSNYDTDVFMPIFKEIERVTGAAPYAGKVGRAEDPEALDMAYRVLADHIRTLTFSITDGGVPSNEGRGYVLRRILRRAIRYAHEKLKAPVGAFASLVDCVVENFSSAFPEVARNPERIKNLLLEEEAQFRKTLDRGIIQFEKFAAASPNGIISGPQAWRLYDTFGFPVDLTRLMAEERGMSVDEVGYAQAQAEAKEISRRGRNGAADGQVDPRTAVVLDVHLTAELEGLQVPKTEDSFKYTAPVIQDCRVLAVVKEGKLLKSSSETGAEGLYGLILDKTNFYAEEGGQSADQGSLQMIDAKSGEVTAEFEVLSVQVYSGWVLHIGSVKFGTFAVGSEGISAAYDDMHRRPLRQNHSATHMLNYALRKCVEADEAIDQKGSLVAADRFRFDFNCARALTDEEIVAVEEKVNSCIKAAWPVNTAVLTLAEARSINGLRAVFGETYPDPVRVVAMGPVDSLKTILAAPSDAKWADFSIELCGGTHVRTTSEIGSLVVMVETNISKGIRRIVAVTGEAAERASQAAAAIEVRVDTLTEGLKEAIAESRVTPCETGLVALDMAIKAVTKEVDEAHIPAVKKSQLQKRVAALRKEVGDALKSVRAILTNRVIDALVEDISKVSVDAGAGVVVKRIDDVEARSALLPTLQKLVKSSSDRAFLLYAVDSAAGRIFYHAASAVPDKIDAAALLRSFTAAIEGAKCGGTPTMAQGSAPIPEKEWESVALASIKNN
jgi:alanyl-tRNA synthetase